MLLFYILISCLAVRNNCYIINQSFLKYHDALKKEYISGYPRQIPFALQISTYDEDIQMASKFCPIKSAYNLQF